MLKIIIINILVFAGFSVLDAFSANPETVADYFITCPFFIYRQADTGPSIEAQADFAGPVALPWGSFICKELLLQGLRRPLVPLQGAALAWNRAKGRFEAPELVPW